jgi:hypothetical protein
MLAMERTRQMQILQANLVMPVGQAKLMTREAALKPVLHLEFANKV